jgi:hypothetical protein
MESLVKEGARIGMVRSRMITEEDRDGHRRAE